MSATAVLAKQITEEEYLTAELLAEVKHEYVDGAVYAMAGASEAHNRIAMNLSGMLYAQLRGKSCEPFGSDMKVRVDTHTHRYYYPDAMVACEPEDSGHGWRERPAALFEIISDDTRRIDEQEKRFLYRQIPSLLAYVRIEQDRPLVVIDRRLASATVEWRTEEVAGLEATVEIPELALQISLNDLYERVKLSA